jgi:hypothetical protein
MSLSPILKNSLSPEPHVLQLPCYPEGLYRWLVSQCVETRRAWDCATGNGQSAVRLAEGFSRVDASDISPAQLFSAQPHSRVYYRECPAEVTPFDDNSFDLVTVGHALHWFHQSSFWPELERVMKPNGVFAAWGYHGCHVTADVDKATAVLMSIIEPFWSSRFQLLWDGYQESGCPLMPMQSPDFVGSSDWTLDQYLGFLNSQPASRLCMQTMGSNVLDQARLRIARAWGQASIVRRVSFPLRLFTARKVMVGSADFCMTGRA